MITTCIIDNYNYARYLLEAIESALSQSVPFDEIIIVDDGSSDCSIEIIEMYEKNFSQINLS
jgi:glycosyltransferase involved in cell wall biosynthesis